jgi:hypothetical protein
MTAPTFLNAEMVSSAEQSVLDMRFPDGAFDHSSPHRIDVIAIAPMTKMREMLC